MTLRRPTVALLSMLWLVPAPVLAHAAQDDAPDAPAGASVLHVQDEANQIVHVNTRIRHTTVIKLPTNENILDFIVGDSEYWHLTGAANLAFLKPIGEGVTTNVALVCESGRIYAFLVTERDAPPHLVVRIGADGDSTPATDHVPAFVARSRVGFIQDDIDIRPWLALSVSGRLDNHSEYGAFFSPRVSALLRSERWSTRVSAGSGFFGPSVLTEETVAAGLTHLEVDGPLRAERGRSVSVDLTHTQGAFSTTATFFGSRIVDPIKVDRSDYVLRTLGEPTTNMGMELLGLFRRSPLAITASYTYVRSREMEDGVTRDVELTPRHSAGLVGMLENEDWRVGLEWYYTGRQRLEDNPYREASESYNIVGVLLERRVGWLRLFVNAENLTDTRQTRWDDPFLRPAGRRWPLDRRCLGTARRSSHQRRYEGGILSRHRMAPGPQLVRGAEGARVTCST